MDYKRNEAYEESLRYFKGDTLAADVFVNKYALKETQGNETIYHEKSPDDMHRRIASELHRIEKKYENPLSEDFIFDLIKDFKYIIPQGSPMSGIGNNKQVVSLSNCFVIGNPSDSYGSIMKVDEEQIQLMKRRGGVGHDLSHIRPFGTPVKNSALTSTGLVPFMSRYSNSTNEVAQGGRRGALMLSCSIKHPNSEQFIDAKLEEGKVTGANISVKITDDFMEAVMNSGMFTQIFPIDSKNPSFTKEIDAQKLWKKIIHNAWKSAEPGVLFWDNIMKESVPDCYQDQGFTTISTNPCIIGNSLIAVADGRNAVSIKQLAEEGKDVSVYCLDTNGKLAIRTMRNPRITGYNQKIYKVIIEGEHFFRVTGNHKFILKDGTEVEAKNLKFGDSLNIMTKSRAAFHDIIKKSNSKSQDYYWLTVSGKKGLIPEHRVISNCYEPNNVVHHKDYNGLNNNPNNLEIMTKEEHDYLHSKNMIGDKNPYHRMTEDWKYNFASHKGETNHKFNNDVTNNNIKKHALILTKKLDRRFSKDDWMIYAKENDLPQFFSDFRYKELGTVTSLSKLSAIELNIEMIDVDPRLVKTYKSALINGYDAEIVENEVLITKNCEECGEEFKINYFRREISFCSHECSLNHTNKDKNVSEKRKLSINEAYLNKGKENKEEQVKIYSELKFELNREPFLTEWEIECKENDIPYRLNTKYGFKNFKEIKEESEYYNHKVISVVEDGFENVYNGTVDDFHNFYFGCFEEVNRFGKVKYISALTRQCGEIPLCPYDSCRLLAINLYSFVNDPFTNNSNFDWNKFKEYVIYAERFMDDIIDLECEKIDDILKKIETDPEPEHIKRVEKETWIKIQDMTIKGRRTGLGVTAEGDMLAALGLRYGTKDATDFSTEVHKILAVTAYKSSAIMAKERGAFPIYDYNREIDNPFIQRLKLSDPELDDMLRIYGRRNIALLTIAPTGSVSIMTQTTSGIEPAYLVSYKRRRKINPTDKSGRVDFVDAEGVNWQDYNVFHHKFETWLSINGYDIDEVKAMKEHDLKNIIEKSPYYKATSNDVDWVEKVRMQGEIQKFVDHSISVTVNLPNNVTEEIVSKVYEMGWRSGCKGITVYRDGSRQGVIMSNEGTTQNVVPGPQENNAKPRTKKLECDVVRFTNNKEKWIGFLGLMVDEKGKKYPYELFTGLADGFFIPPSVEKGEIVRFKEDGSKSRYDFIFKDKDGYNVTMEGLNRAFNREFWNTSKLISAFLRHRIHLPSVIDLIDSLQLDSDVASFGTWKSGVKRIIKKYINSTAIGESCPECGATGNDLVYEAGCKTCKNCGWSKCE